MITEKYEKLLDIRRIAKQQIDLKILIDKLLSPTQKLLLRFQRKRIEAMSDSTSDDYSKENRNDFLQKISNFETSNHIDRNLLRGVIFTD